MRNAFEISHVEINHLIISIGIGREAAPVVTRSLWRSLQIFIIIYSYYRCNLNSKLTNAVFVLALFTIIAHVFRLQAALRGALRGITMKLLIKLLRKRRKARGNNMCRNRYKCPALENNEGAMKPITALW